MYVVRGLFSALTYQVAHLVVLLPLPDLLLDLGRDGRGVRDGLLVGLVLGVIVIDGVDQSLTHSIGNGGGCLCASMGPEGRGGTGGDGRTQPSSLSSSSSIKPHTDAYDTTIITLLLPLDPSPHQPIHPSSPLTYLVGQHLHEVGQVQLGLRRGHQPQGDLVALLLLPLLAVGYLVGRLRALVVAVCTCMCTYLYIHIHIYTHIHIHVGTHIPRLAPQPLALLFGQECGHDERGLLLRLALAREGPFCGLGGRGLGLVEERLERPKP